MSFDMSPARLLETRRNHKANEDLDGITRSAIISRDELQKFMNNLPQDCDGIRVNLIRFPLTENTPKNAPDILTANGVLSQISLAFEPVRVIDRLRWSVRSMARDGNVLCVCPPERDSQTGLCPPKCGDDEGM